MAWSCLNPPFSRLFLPGSRARATICRPTRPVCHICKADMGNSTKRRPRPTGTSAYHPGGGARSCQPRNACHELPAMVILRGRTCQRGLPQPATGSRSHQHAFDRAPISQYSSVWAGFSSMAILIMTATYITHSYIGDGPADNNISPVPHQILRVDDDNASSGQGITISLCFRHSLKQTFPF